MNQKEMNETIWRKNIQVERKPWSKKTMKVVKGMIWYTKYDKNGEPEMWYGKLIKGGNK